MFKKLALSMVAFAIPLGVMAIPAMANAAPEVPPAVYCANLKAQLATAQSQLTSVNRLIIGYQNTINTLQTSRQTLINKGLGESASAASLTTQINYYQNLLNGLYSQQNSLQWQVFCLGLQYYYQCGGPPPFLP